MILGEHKRECMNCREMLPYKDFDYEYDLDDIENQSEYHVNNDCYECYKNREQPIYQVAPVKIVQDLSVHAPQCPICLSNTGCGCNDVDSDGYR